MISHRGNQAWGLWELSTLSSQGFCKFKTVLKLIDYLKNEIVMIAGENKKGKTRVKVYSRKRKAFKCHKESDKYIVLGDTSSYLSMSSTWEVGDPQHILEARMWRRERLSIIDGI